MKFYLHRLHIDVTNRCTLSCSECNRNIPFFRGNPVDLSAEKMMEHLKIICDKFDIHSIIFEGGEPLLCPHLIDLVKIIKKENFSQFVGLTTNCTLIDKCNDELLSLVDLWQLSIYPGVIPQKNIDEFVVRLKAAGKMVVVNLMNHFRRTFRKTKEIAVECAFCRNCYNYTNGYLFVCPAAYSINTIIHGKVIDGVYLEANDAYAQIKNMMTSPVVYYDACNYCDLHKSEEVPWAQITRQEWVKSKGL